MNNTPPEVIEKWRAIAATLTSTNLQVTAIANLKRLRIYLARLKKLKE